MILASTSIYRKQLMDNCGFAFRAIAPRLDEDQLKQRPYPSARDMAETLALAKALSLQPDYPDEVIVGSDQVCLLGDEVFGKPRSRQKAIDQLSALSGRRHQLITAIAILRGPLQYVSAEVTTLTMKKLSVEDIESYVDRDQPLDCAGGYKLEMAGIALMEHIETSDPTAIQGLPMVLLTNTLTEWNIPLSQLWKRESL